MCHSRVKKLEKVGMMNNGIFPLWTLNDSIIEIKASKHGMGKNPTTTTYIKTDTGYAECFCGIEKDDNGNITITVSNHSKIEGKVVITG
jgi:hypothetical protein